RVPRSGSRRCQKARTWRQRRSWPCKRKFIAIQAPVEPATQGRGVHALHRELTGLAGVGPALKEKLARLELHRVEDLLFFLPLRYEDRTELVRPGALRPGMRCLTSGRVLLAEAVYRGRRSLLVRIGDGTGQLTLRSFHFSRQQQAQFRTGSVVSCDGDVRPGPVGVEIVHPEYRILKEGESPVLKEELTPVYPTTEGVQQGRLRNLTGQ